MRYLLVLLVISAGCDRADMSEPAPLPPLERPSPEARAGLPELAGTWIVAAPAALPEDTLAGDGEADAGTEEEDLPAVQSLTVAVQRLDSLAAELHASGGAMLPLTGEVRRDGVISVGTSEPIEGRTRFLAGRLDGDTLWLTFTDLPEAVAFPAGARVPLVRGD